MTFIPERELKMGRENPLPMADKLGIFLNMHNTHIRAFINRRVG